MQLTMRVDWFEEERDEDGTRKLITNRDLCSEKPKP